MPDSKVWGKIQTWRVPGYGHQYTPPLEQGAVPIIMQVALLIFSDLISRWQGHANKHFSGVTRPFDSLPDYHAFHHMA